METHEIEYEGLPLATVEIDHEKATPCIKEMVEFWMGWEEKLADNGGNYIETWLKMLGMFIMRNHQPPKGNEGWDDLDGQQGIKLTDWTPWQPDETAITIA